MHDSRDSKRIWRLHHPGVVKGGRLLQNYSGVDTWGKEYNENRPHQALSELTPSEFAVKSRHLSTSEVIGGAET